MDHISVKRYNKISIYHAYPKSKIEPRLNGMRFCHWLCLIAGISLWDAFLPTGITFFLIHLSEVRKYSKRVTQLGLLWHFFTWEKYIKTEEKKESCKWFSCPRQRGSTVVQNRLCLKEWMYETERISWALKESSWPGQKPHSVLQSEQVQEGQGRPVHFLYTSHYLKA